LKRPAANIGERVLLTLWVGGLWTMGYMVAPALFATLEDRALAGTLAGVMFNIIAWTGMACAPVLLVINQLRYPQRRLNWRMLVLLAMLLLVILGQFVFTPMMVELRGAGQSDAAAFARLHGIASLVYLVNSVLGLVLVMAQESPPADG